MKNVKELRKAAGLSQNDLAKKLGVSRTTVTMWESSGQYPRSGTITRLADVLGCSIDDLFERPVPGSIQDRA